MVRWFALILLTGSMLAQMSTSSTQTGGAAAQARAAEQAPAAESAVPEASSGFPFDAFPQFSAVMVGSVGGDIEEAHIYRSGKMLRTQAPEGVGYYITDLEKLDAYGLSLTGCMHDPHPYMRAFPFTAARKDRKVERVAGGKETVDGHVCQVEDVTISSGSLANPMQLRFWEAEDLHGFPIKVAVLKGPHTVIRYKDVAVGPQDPTLFMHPTSCKGTVPQPPAKLPVIRPKAMTPPGDAPAK